MVRAIVDQMRVHNANPNRGICAKVIKDIVRKYPVCFRDVDDMELAGASLLQQVKNRIEHVNRNNTLARIRVEKQNRASNSQAGARVRGPEDTYGCVRWGPAELPSGETEDSLQQMKTDLQQVYAQVGIGV